jgi:hypothetical protein
MRIALAAIAVAASIQAASAQSLSPMRGEVRSFTDRFAVRVFVGNPYQRRMQFEVAVYDRNFFPAVASVVPSRVTIGGGETQPVLVVVPFEGQNERRVRICVEGVAYNGNSTRVRTQVCGKFVAHSFAQEP